MAHESTSKLIEKYCRDYPDVLSRTLARMIYGKHPDLFTSMENVRGVIRHYRGAKGPGRPSPFPELIREQKHIKEWMRNVHLPSDAAECKNYVIPKTIKKTLLISDLHLPYHNLEAVLTAIDTGVTECVDSVIINGDLIDFHQLSRFTHDPGSRSVVYEIDLAQEFFDVLREALPQAQIYYKLGNHEQRWETYFKSKAPEIFGDSYFRLEDRLNLAQWDVKHIAASTVIKYGKLNIIHGHEFGGSFFNPVNPARGLFNRAKSSTIAGHNHQTSEHHENNLNNDQIACWSTGCLCELSPEYRPLAFTRWNLGFAILSKTADGSFTVVNRRIIEGKVH